MTDTEAHANLGQEPEYKHLPIELEVKQDDEAGVFEGYGAFFGNVDSYGDVIEKGAFAEAVKMQRRKNGRKVKMLWQHDMRSPIGVFDEMYEDDKGLYVKGRLLINQGVPDADRAYALMKAGAMDGLSIGYMVEDADMTRAGRRKIKAVNLLEISAVTFPANEKAVVTGVKSELDYSVRGVERVLRDAGYPRSFAKAVPLHGVKDADTDECDAQGDEKEAFNSEAKAELELISNHLRSMEKCLKNLKP